MRLLLCLLAGQADGAARIDGEVGTVRRHREERRAGPAADSEFLRRVMLDLVGTPPTAAQARAFLDDPDPAKRDLVVDRLLDSDAFARFWARRIADFLIEDAPALPLAEGHPVPDELRGSLLARFEGWLTGALRRDAPWSDIVSELLTAQGRPEEQPALVYKLSFVGRDAPFLQQLAGNVPRHLLGLDFRCAVCHDHPFDRWTTDDVGSVAAFFSGQRADFDRAAGRLSLADDPAAPLGLMWKDPGYWGSKEGPRWFLGGAAVPGQDRPAVFAKLLTAPDSPYFDRAIANRVWSWLLGRGLVEPVDAIDLKNKPLSKSLLDTITAVFREQGRSIRSFVRVVCATKAYRRSSEAADAAGSMALERQALVPLSPEQLLNALQTATLGAPRRDASEIGRLTGVLSAGRRIGCEVRPLPAGTLHALYLRNSEELWGWITEGPVLAGIRALAPARRIDELFLTVLGRPPSEPERGRFARFLASAPLEDALWILLNSAEFLTRS